ncbi:hypothetical protein [Desulfitobacterium sp. AusDCA]|uniref:hypothetical protein n=1 Tax=Desulfitobacterium sp. AusDCA TaxID=3240383 RepID=UPI003DA78942
MFLKLKNNRYLIGLWLRPKLVYGFLVVLMAFFGGAPYALAAGGGALPTTNPFVVNWDDIFNGGVGSQIIPLVNWGLGLFGLYLLIRGIVGILHISKELMKGNTDYKKFIPVGIGFILVLLFLTGGWYNLLYGILNVVNKSFSAAPKG